MKTGLNSHRPSPSTSCEPCTGQILSRNLRNRGVGGGPAFGEARLFPIGARFDKSFSDRV